METERRQQRQAAPCRRFLLWRGTERNMVVARGGKKVRNVCVIKIGEIICLCTNSSGMGKLVLQDKRGREILKRCLWVNLDLFPNFSCIFFLIVYHSLHQSLRFLRLYIQILLVNVLFLLTFFILCPRVLSSLHILVSWIQCYFFFL